jgi:hypothetical protein
LLYLMHPLIIFSTPSFNPIKANIINNIMKIIAAGFV